MERNRGRGDGREEAEKGNDRIEGKPGWGTALTC